MDSEMTPDPDIDEPEYVRETGRVNTRTDLLVAAGMLTALGMGIPLGTPIHPGYEETGPGHARAVSYPPEPPRLPKPRKLSRRERRAKRK